MTLTNTERRILFYSVVSVAIAFVLVEIFVVVSFYRRPDWPAAAFGGVGVLAIAGAFKGLMALWNRTFLTSDLITGDLLQDTFHVRRGALKSRAKQGCSKEVSSAIRTLIESNLKLLHRLLYKKVGSHDFELSVFCGESEPRIVAYYDSSGKTEPRSHREREQNPNYYIEKEYEVIELLRDPSAQFIVIPATRSANYTFVTDRQKSQIKSTMLHVLSAEWPAALVVTCDEKNAFEEDDLLLKQVVRALGAAVLVDLELVRADLNS